MADPKRSMTLDEDEFKLMQQGNSPRNIMRRRELAPIREARDPEDQGRMTLTPEEKRMGRDATLAGKILPQPAPKENQYKIGDLRTPNSKFNPNPQEPGTVATFAEGGKVEQSKQQDERLKYMGDATTATRARPGQSGRQFLDEQRVYKRGGIVGPQHFAKGGKVLNVKSYSK